MSTKRYEVKARRSGNWWALEVPAVPGVFAQVRRLDQADAAAREAIALLLDVPESDVDTDVVADLPVVVLKQVAAARRAQDEASEKVAAAARLSREVVSELLAEGLPMRDVGKIMDVSHQRVAQLAHDVKSPKGVTVKK